jgi:predicted RND superfamily exporter protein
LIVSRIIDELIAWRWLLLIAAGVAAVVCWQPAQQVRYERRLETMFSPLDPLLPPFERLKERFGAREVVLAVYEDPQLFAEDESGLKRLAKISERLRQAPGVDETLSLAELQAMLSQLDATNLASRIGNLFGGKASKPALLDPDNKLGAAFVELFEGYTHSADRHVAAIVCLVRPEVAVSNRENETASVPRAETLAGLRKVLSDLPDGLPPGQLVGEPVMVTDGFEQLERDGARLNRFTTLLLAAVILIAFHSPRWVLIQVLVVQWALLVTRGVMGLAGLQMSMVSSMLGAIVTVVGVGTTVHLIVACRENRLHGASSLEAFRMAGRILAGPILGAIATDVAGFGSLLISSVGPVKDFGLFAAVGSAFVLVAVMLVTPAPALALPALSGTPRPGWGDRGLSWGLMQTLKHVRERPKFIAALAIAIAVLAFVGTLKLEVETDFTRNFLPDNPLVKSYEFVESRLGGAGVWDVMLPAPKRMDREYVARVEQLETALRGLTIEDSSGRTRPALSKVLSLVDTLQTAGKHSALGALAPEEQVSGMAAVMPAFLQTLRSEADAQGRRWLRIMLRAEERQPAEVKKQIIADVTRLAQNAFPESETGPGAEVTGIYVLLANLIDSVNRDQWTTFGLATGAIFLLVWISFRRLDWAAMSLIPNALPIVLVMGSLGWLGLRVNMGAAMIAAVSMGLSVDSSIHYLAAYRRARRAAASTEQALFQVQHQVGRAATLSTLALIVGFSVLMTSQFVPTIYFGGLVSLAMLGGLAGNLVILPLLLSLTERD